MLTGYVFPCEQWTIHKKKKMRFCPRSFQDFFPRFKFYLFARAPVLNIKLFTYLCASSNCKLTSGFKTGLNKQIWRSEAKMLHKKQKCERQRNDSLIWHHLNTYKQSWETLNFYFTPKSRLQMVHFHKLREPVLCSMANLVRIFFLRVQFYVTVKLPTEFVQN